MKPKLAWPLKRKPFDETKDRWWAATHGDIEMITDLIDTVQQ